VISLKIKFCLLFFLAGTGIVFSSNAYAETVTFFTDVYYDPSGRDSLTASIYHEGDNARWYISDEYWLGLSSEEGTVLLGHIKNLSSEFDKAIYPKLTALFGSENNPGVDNDPKITVFITDMIEDAGGYFREQDGFLKSKVQKSNAREMIYLNVLHIDKDRARSFLAHEFQHLITFNQKTVKHDAQLQEEIWLNELRSEIASTILGYDAPGVYRGSNLESRAATFLRTPSDAILDWENEARDYASINLFGQYILDHYGRSVIATMIGNSKVGVESFSEALKVFGFKEDFSDVFTNWTIANLVNDCTLEPINTYCYKNPSLDYSNFHIIFNAPEASGETVSSGGITADWRADWLKLEKNLTDQKPQDHVFKLDFSSAETSNFVVPYVVYGKDGKSILEISQMELLEGKGVFYVENFGFTVPQVVIIPTNQAYFTGTTGGAPETAYSVTATTINEVPATPTSTLPTGGQNPPSSGGGQDPAPNGAGPDFPNGTLIRASNYYRVYIIQDGYKRWIQTDKIFDFYGHLNFGAVSVVSAETLALYKDSWLVRASGNEKVYEINGDGTRHWLDMTPEKFSATGHLWDMVYVINQSELEWYKEGASVK